MKVGFCIVTGVVVSVVINILSLLFNFSAPKNLFDWIFDAVMVTAACLLVRYIGVRKNKLKSR